MTKETEDQFIAITHRYYAEEPGYADSYYVKALYVFNAPKGKYPFVIVEEWTQMAHPLMIQCHFYNSKENMLAAYRKGLARYVFNKKPSGKQRNTSTLTISELFTQGLDQNELSHFKDRPGYLSTIDNDLYHNATPWFMAKKGDRIKGDWVVGSEMRSILPGRNSREKQRKLQK